MNIEEIKNAILSEPKGKKMRKLIHDAISLCYEHGAKSGNVNMELAAARGDKSTLGERLSSIQTEVATALDLIKLKLNKNEIINNLISTEIQKPLSALQGKILKELIDGLGVEKGSNPNGYYWKYADGRLITEKIYKNQTAQTSEKVESLRYKWLFTHTFPIQFVEIPSVEITPSMTRGNGVYWGINQAVTTENAQIVLMGAGNNTFYGDIVVRCTGRWK